MFVYIGKEAKVALIETTLITVEYVLYSDPVKWRNVSK